jgi:hypothetical protein
MRLFLVFLILSFFKVNCNDSKTVGSSDRIKEIQLFTGRDFNENLLTMQADIDKAYVNGVSFPNDNEFFRFSIDITNEDDKDQNYFYKIYYQNKSYKFIERDTADGGKYNIESADNFYGSWENTDVGFKAIGKIEKGNEKIILDSFRIVGNPRNELKYYGTPIMNKIIEDETIKRKMNDIKSNGPWYESILAKAKQSKLSPKEQLFIDAQWIINNMMDPSEKEVVEQDSTLEVIKQQILSTPDWTKSIKEKALAKNIGFENQLEQDVNWSYSERNSGRTIYENNRKKRNPRMGEYEFLIVVLTEQELNQVPISIQNIDRVDVNHGTYLNPFYYFEHEFKGSKGAYQLAQQRLKVSSKFIGDRGVYIDPLAIRDINSSKEFYNDLVGSSKKLYENAHYEQYFHVINKDYTLKNVPISADVVEGPYSKTQFESNKQKFSENLRKTAYTQITDSPGKTVYYDSLENAVKIFNPGSHKPSEWAKENVGVKTRVGFSYGKYTGKIKFAKTLNKDNIWNGLTSAFWLFSEEMKPWNERNTCYKEGYLPKAEKKPSTNKFPKSMYSEIDIEIVKTSKYWPKTSYGGIEDYPIDDPENNNNLIVTCTNWDMTCQDPQEFNQGVKFFEYEGHKFGLHRWDYWYHALTSKHERSHDETVGGIYYYQIDWRPNEIIWKIGRSLDKLDVVSYMNSKNTKIPSNQMITIVTQEFHYADWWPLSPYDQDNVPFPSADIEGFVYEITVE